MTAGERIVCCSVFSLTPLSSSKRMSCKRPMKLASETDWQIAPWLWADQRVRVCGLPPAMQWRSPAGEVWPLAVTPTADGACADVWPTEAGWHTLETPTGDIRQPVYVHPAEAVPSLQVLQLRDATLDLAQHSPREPASATHTQPGPSWPWALLWLLCSAGLAWVERRDRRPSA